MAEMVQLLSLRRQTIARMVKEHRFPAPIKLTAHRVGWRWSAVLQWLSQREAMPSARRPYTFGSDSKSA